MSTIAHLNVMFSTDTRSLTRGLREASKRTRKFSQTAKREVTRIGRTFRGVTNNVVNMQTAIATLAGTGGIGLLVRSQMRAIQTTERLQRISGIHSRTIEALGVQSREYGITQERTNDALVDFSERVGEARTGTGEAVDGFKMLESATGRSINLGQNVNAVWRDFVSAMGEVEDASRRSAIAAQVGGDALRDILPVLEEGEAGFQNAAQEAERMGLALNRLEIAQVMEANRAISRLQDSFTGLSRQITVDLAPHIEAVGQVLAESAQDSQRLSGSIVSMAKTGGSAIGALADGVHGLRIAFKGGEVLVHGFKEAVLDLTLAAAENLSKVIDLVIRDINRTITALNYIPGVDIATIDPIGDSPFMKSLRGMAQEAREATSKAQGELHDLAMQKLPSQRIDEFFAEVERKAAKFNPKPIDAISQGQEGSPDREAEEQRRQSLEQRLENLKSHLRSEEEQERLSHRKRLEDLKLIRESEIGQKLNYQEMREELEALHQDRLNKIRRKGWTESEKIQHEALKAMESGWSASASFVSSQLQSMTDGIAQHSRAAFEINKAASIAQALLKVPEAASNAYAWASAFGGPPAGAAAAATAAAAQLAQVKAIKSTSFSGSGSGAAPSVSGSTPADPVTPVSEQQDSGPDRRVYVEFEGSDDQQVSLRQFRKSVRKLREENPDAELVF